jgi:hypothetical protein
MNPGKLMEYEDVGEGKLEVSLNLGMLYGKGKERQKFENNYAKYSDLEENAIIVKERGKDHLIYYSEQIIPRKRDDKPSVLLVFGNPASHSVISGMFFSYQGKNKEQEHRLWGALRKAGIFKFNAENMVLNNSERNELRKKALFELTYTTPFRMGLAVYYSMPSPASEKSWGGVSGLQRLFSKKALEQIWEAEKFRINELIRRFIKEDGAVITFQKDAWNGIKSKNDPHYCRAEMLEGYLMGKCDCCEGVRLYCAPTTRNILGKKSIEILADIKKSILNKDKI